ncbi:MAG: hypothetical protein Q4A83_00730 [Bacillota bacterium]|nr:hypothetical protein [Bacillota bacterium]
MDKRPDFQNFDAVWARVTEASEGFSHISPEIPEKEAQQEEKICILPRCEKSRAVRFIPEI